MYNYNDSRRFESDEEYKEYLEKLREKEEQEEEYQEKLTDNIIDDMMTFPELYD